jgi:hypothetical protein
MQRHEWAANRPGKFLCVAAINTTCACLPATKLRVAPTTVAAVLSILAWIALRRQFRRV